MQDIIIRQYREGDERVINDLFNGIFNEKRPSEEWYWKFRDDPQKSQRMITVAEVNGRIIGQYASLVTLFKYGDRTFPFPQPVDNFVCSDFRGGMKGIQKAMFDGQPEAVARIGAPFGLGFPNRDAYVVGKRMLKYKDIGKMPVLFKLLNLYLPLKKRMPWLPSGVLRAVRSMSAVWFRLLLAASQGPRVPGVRVRTVEAFDRRVDALWERTGQRHKIVAVRDFRYLNWRYKKPGSNYRILLAERSNEVVGYAVFRVKSNAVSMEGHLVDLFTDGTPGVDRLLVRKALALLTREQVDYALCWMLRDKPSFAALTGLGFSERDSFPPGNIVYFIFDPAAIDETFVTNTENWFLTMGDSDAF